MKLARRFVAVADEVGRLQRGRDPECRLFQKIAEQGHYAGRERPTNTRQGIYATAPSGVLLSSVNTRRPERVAKMLREALEKWNTLSAGERLLAGDPRTQRRDVKRLESRYPEGGLVLKLSSRDLPRPETERPGDWRAHAWNRDYAWFKADEARSFLPPHPESGATHVVPKSLVERLACLHLVDNIRGQTSPYDPEDVEEARLTTTITSVKEHRVSLRLDGRSHTSRKGSWSVDGFRDHRKPAKRARGFEADLEGRAVYDLARGRFVSFELVALGRRWGGTTYNARQDDLEGGPMGVAMTLAGPDERVAPAWIWRYRW